MRILLVLILNLSLMLSTSATQAQDTSGDWVEICEQSGSFSGRCYINQTLTLKQSGQKLFQIAAGYPFNEDLPMILVSAPLGIYLPSGIILRVDQTEPYRAVVAYCNSDGCHAYYRLTRRVLNFFRQGRWLNVTFVDGTRRQHQFKVSLNGFTAALQNLRK